MEVMHERRKIASPTRIAILEEDPLRYVGFRTVFESLSDFELIEHNPEEASPGPPIDVVLLGRRKAQDLFDAIARLRRAHPQMNIMVTGSSADDEILVKALAAGARGYLDQAASPTECVKAVAIVQQGSIWAPRRVISLFLDWATSSPDQLFPAEHVTLTTREREALELLVAGRTNREIGKVLGITERTVKAHVAKLLKKVGVRNRMALSIRALSSNLVAKK